MSVRSKANDLSLVSQVLIRLGGVLPQGLKPVFSEALSGTAEAVPFHKSVCESNGTLPSHNETAAGRNHE
jgi:hypothetical protein